MLDIKYIRENPEEVIARLQIKGKDAREDIEAPVEEHLIVELYSK